MKKIEIPLFRKKEYLYIYIGGKELKEFTKIIQEKDRRWKPKKDIDGYHWENYIWIEDITDLEIVFHEMQHFLDYCFENYGCEKESEFKAVLASYFLTSVMLELDFVIKE